MPWDTLNSLTTLQLIEAQIKGTSAILITYLYILVITYRVVLMFFAGLFLTSLFQWPNSSPVSSK